MIEVNYQNALSDSAMFYVPSKADVLACLTVVITQLQEKKPIELTVRFVDTVEMVQLNTDFRKKNKPTNVLTFPYEQPEIQGLEEEADYLGDIVICAEVVDNEAKQQQKTLEEHWLHMIVHGCLHLYGYDHILDEEAVEMESLETLILLKMGMSSPYE